MPPRPTLIVVAAVAVLAGTAGCGRSGSRDRSARSRDHAVIVVDAPFAAQAALSTTLARGAELAAAEINAAGGVPVGHRKVQLDVRRVDDRLSPATAAANIRAAASDNAVAVVAEGLGVDVAAADAGRAGLPVGIVYEGGSGLVDRATRPSVFRIAPTDRGVAFRLAERLVPKGLHIAILRDDTQYGDGGGAALDHAFARNRDTVVADLVFPAAGDPAPQVLDARRRGATALLVWARPAGIAAVVRAARSAGWDAPIATPPSGEDSLVREQLADHPEWVDGLVFATGRLTSEKGTEPFERFRDAYEHKYGAERVAVTSNGKPVVQPPDWAMYPYDFVHVVAAAMTRSGSAGPSPALVAAMEQVEVPGANGDERAFNEVNHEGVVDDDIFFAEFRSMVWAPVRDDPLSATLPAIPQTAGG